MIKDITDLNVYNEALELLPRLYKLLEKLPISERDLEIQAKRAAKSVSANIDEYKILSRRINTLHKKWRFGGNL